MALSKNSKHEIRVALENFEDLITTAEEKSQEEEMLTEARKQIDYLTYRDRKHFNFIFIILIFTLCYR